MDADRLRDVVEVVIVTNFEQCAAAFKDRPSVKNWADLTTAMWARQGLTSTETMAKALPQLEESGVGRWPELLRQTHESQLK